MLLVDHVGVGLLELHIFAQGVVYRAGSDFLVGQLSLVLGDESIVLLLRERGADVNSFDHFDSAPALASGRGDEALVNLLVVKGADINGKIGRPLTSAAGEGNEAIIKLLLEKGADIYAKNHVGLAFAAPP